MRVAVIGGGIIGLATTDALVSAGIDTLCFERKTVGSGSTERANGGIRAQFSTRSNVILSQVSLEAWNSFEDRYDVDIQFRRNGYLFLTDDPETAERFRTTVEMQNDLDVPSEYLTPGAVERYSPGIKTEQIAGATFSPSDGFADPHLALQGFLERSRSEGARIEQHTPVTAIRREADGFIVETEADRHAVDAVVNAAGPWAGSVAGMLGHSLPVRLIRRQLAILQPERPLSTTHPYVYHVDRKISFRPERHPDSLVSGGYEGATSEVSDPVTYRRSMDLEFARSTTERLAKLTAYFGPDTKIKGGWSGLYTVTPDHNPIIDELEPGFVVATGFSGHGFMHAPAVARLLFELLTDEASPFVDPGAYRLDRFEDNTGNDERFTP